MDLLVVTGTYLKFMLTAKSALHNPAERSSRSHFCQNTDMEKAHSIADCAPFRAMHDAFQESVHVFPELLLEQYRYHEEHQ